MSDSAASTLSPFTASDGENLAVQDWPLAEDGAQGEAPRGTILLVHGLGEHAGRYDALARRLNGWGFAVRGYDQFGHGESGGVRGALTSNTRLLDDLADIVDATRARMPAGRPLVLLGHSLGGLVAALFVAQRLRLVDALVLSSPALDAGLNPLQRLMLATLARAAPDLRVGNGVDVDALSHDPAVATAYRADRLCHDRISGRLARFIAHGGAAVLAQAGDWQVPTLLLWAGQDRLVRPAGSAAFVAAAPPGVVQAQCFDGLFHEIFNEPDAGPVFTRLEQWLETRCPA